METMILSAILLSFFSLVVGIVVLVLVLRKPGEETGARVEALLREAFQNFQSQIHQEVNSARDEVARSKDLIGDYTIKTLNLIKDMGTTINRIIEQQEEAQKLGQDLRDLLKAPKLRGNFGETILEEMLERVLPKGIWERQFNIDGQNRVDAVIKVKDVLIPIDAKFPRDDYMRYIVAEDAQQKQELWKKYEASVKNQISDIRKKYIKPDKGTVEFAIMFIPSEAIYYETIAEKNSLGNPSDLYRFALDNSVVPVSPNTLYAFLQVIVIAVRNIEVIKNAKRLQDMLKKIEESFRLFFNQYEEIGKKLESASEAYRKADLHIRRFKDNVDKTLRLEAVDEKEALSPPNRV
jgi:DNA recombination protein RmuC